MNTLTDQEIIQSVLNGNTADFNLLINRYKQKAFSMLNRILRNRMDAEEVLQDSFMKAYTGLSRFRNESRFSTWFYRIVYNNAMNRVKRKGLKIEREMISVDEDFDIEGGELHPENTDISKILDDAINRLPAAYSSVINLFYINDCSCEEISSITGQSVANVKVLLFRARKALKNYLEKNNLHKELL